jgi:hypothetical protein
MRRSGRAFSWPVRPVYTSCVSAILVACSGSATNKTEPAPSSGSADPAARPPEDSNTGILDESPPDEVEGHSLEIA